MTDIFRPSAQKSPQQTAESARKIEEMCVNAGLKMTDQRRVIASVIAGADDHPDVQEIHRRASAVDSRISIATVYRTMKAFEELKAVERHDFGDGRARYEEISEEHHDHLIDVRSGNVIEFVNEEIEQLQVEVARKLGYKLLDHKLELYAVPLGEGE